MNINSIAASPRIRAVDFIRGTALFGILVINSQTYSLFAFLRPEQVYALQLDQPDQYAPVQFFIHLFFKGQFYTIYSFLFGLGFHLMWEKNQKAGLDPGNIFRRRLWLLLAFGIIHALIFWFGDVLHKYALLGFTLPYLSRKPVSVLWKWIGGLAFFVIVFQTMHTFFFPGTAADVDRVEFDKVIMQVVDTWKHGSFAQVMSLQKLGVIMLYVLSLQNGLAGFVHYEIMFILGLLVGKMRLFEKIPESRIKLMRITFWLFPVAVLIKAVSCLTVLQVQFLSGQFALYQNLALSLAEFISVPFLSVVYLIELTLLYQSASAGLPGRVMELIANTGRMGLTNYLLQTLICMVVFYGYAGALAGRLTLAESVIPVFLIYIFQVIYSNIWLKRHRTGPMEMLWNKLTYAKQETKGISGKKTILHS